MAQSRSPVIHNHWLAHYGIAGRYVLFPVPPEKLEAAVRGIAVLGLRGCNVTTPHKQAVFRLLDRVDDLARRIGAVNTVVVEKDGTLTGFNNDGNGFILSLMSPSSRIPTGRRPTFLRMNKFARHGTSSVPNCGGGLRKWRGPTGPSGTLSFPKKISPRILRGIASRSC